jgi:hypothetical protein
LQVKAGSSQQRPEAAAANAPAAGQLLTAVAASALPELTAPAVPPKLPRWAMPSSLPRLCSSGGTNPLLNFRVAAANPLKSFCMYPAGYRWITTIVPRTRLLVHLDLEVTLPLPCRVQGHFGCAAGFQPTGFVYLQVSRPSVQLAGDTGEQATVLTPCLFGYNFLCRIYTREKLL